MITRLLVDNFRCFSNLEVQLGPQCLIIGGNGTGKSAFLEVLTRIQAAVTGNVSLDDSFPLFTKTRWRSDPKQTFELDVALREGRFRYTLEIDRIPGNDRPRVSLERLSLEGKPLFSFEAETVQLYTDDHRESATYPLDSHRSGLSVAPVRAENAKLTAFRAWMGNALFLRPHGLLNQANVSNAESLSPGFQFQFFFNWYRRLTNESPSAVYELNRAVKEFIPGLEELKFESFGPNSKMLVAEHARPGRGDKFKLFFDEFSDGQKILVALYAVLHFAVARGATVFIDEPDNFVSIRELQPWMSELDRAQPDGSRYVLISHNPEVIDNFTLDEILHFRRLGDGIVRAESLPGNQESNLPVRELLARGWLGE